MKSKVYNNSFRSQSGNAWGKVHRKYILVTKFVVTICCKLTGGIILPVLLQFFINIPVSFL